jgi:nucleoside-diphosphate-sugar epimerase
MNKNILITGGSGFLGENIIKALKKEYKKINIYTKRNLKNYKNI